jgi:hypothetical protein
LDAFKRSPFFWNQDTGKRRRKYPFTDVPATSFVF